MKHRWLTLLLAAAGCGPGPATSPDQGMQSDLAGSQYLLSGTFAMRLRMSVGLSGDGGAQMDSLDQTLVANTFFSPNSDGTAGISVMWHPCGFSLPGGLSIPYAHVLEQKLLQTQNGTLSGKGEAEYVQPPVSFTFGACLLAASDALPTDNSKLCPAAADPTRDPCAQTAMRGCAVSTVDGVGATQPGIPVAAQGLTPDADVLYVDGRVSFSLTGTPRADGTIDGAVTAGGVEWHVLACHLRGAGACSAGDVAKLNASRPTLTVSGGMVAAHDQPSYFNCAQFLTGVEAALTGLEMFDGGAPDIGTMSVGFQDVQSEMDQLGCGTCHDQFFTPKMNLVYQPWTEAQLRYNYQQVLPWTLSTTMHGAPVPGGRFVNQAPVPAPIRARWLKWIADGAPY